MIHDKEAARDFLWELITEQAPGEGLTWLQEKRNEFQKSDQDRIFYLTFSAVPRYLGKAPLKLSQEDLKRAEAIRSGFRPTGWTIDQAARVWLLLHLPHEDEEDFMRRMEMLFEHADMGELVALYSSLPLLPHAKRFIERTAEGIRTNMTVVFDAVALDNPYPAEQLSENAWNQMVLKAAFMDRPIYRIRGLKKRSNANLAHIISDYAHERWAAGRVVSPEFWRPVGAFVNERILADLQRLFESENPLQREAAALVCADSEHPKAKALLANHPALQSKIADGILSWDQLALTWWREKAKEAAS